MESKMRKDMNRVLVDTNRVGAGLKKGKKHKCLNHNVVKYRNNKIKLLEFEDEDGEIFYDIEDTLPTKLGMTPKNSISIGENKDFGENLGPLRNFLNSRVGQHWDKIYSEISAVRS